METVRQEGTREVQRLIDFYNLDLVIAVGYRVNSERAIIFRTWATGVLKEYIKKGSVLDVERLKQPEYIFGQDYFNETLERIRDIRSSERRFYQTLPIFTLNAAQIMMSKASLPRHFSPPYKINFIGQLVMRPQPKSFTRALVTKRKIWA